MKCLTTVITLIHLTLAGNIFAQIESRLVDMVIIDFADVEIFVRTLEIVNNREEEFNFEQQVSKWIHGDKQDLEQLYDLALDQDANSATIEALARLQTYRAADILTEIARRENSVMGLDARKALSRMPTHIAAPRLVEMLKDPVVSDRVKRLVIGYLRKHPGANVEAALLEEASNASNRKIAISALGVVGTSKSLKTLEVYSNSTDPDVRAIAAYAIKRVKDRATGRDPNKELEQNEQAVQKSVRRALENQTGTTPSPVAQHTPAVKRYRTVALEEAKSVGEQLSLIQRQVLQSEEVKKAISSFGDLLYTKVIYIDPHVESRIRNIEPREYSNEVITTVQEALRDPKVKMAGEQAMSLMLRKMVEIEPKVPDLLREFGRLVTQLTDKETTVI